MDFALPHVHDRSVATVSNIRHLPVDGSGDDASRLDDMLIEAANRAATDLFLQNDAHDASATSAAAGAAADCRSYPERSTPQSETIEPDSLVVIFESFDNLKFCYAKRGTIFSNRNGHFHHDDFLGKPFGCKVRSRNNRGYGFVYLLKPTPELWARSLNHRTQIVHELDASMIAFYLDLRPNMVVCESGTGSGALSHVILRSIAPHGTLHTYEFNRQRAEAAAEEFAKNGVSRLVTVHHRDVCGKHGPGGFDRPGASVDAVVLDLPEPWAAVPHAAHCVKPNGRVASYSPCVEQSQQTVAAMKAAGFHSIRTVEFRLKEHYVDEVEYEMPPTEKRPRAADNRSPAPHTLTATAGRATPSGGEDTEAEADHERSDYETEAARMAAGFHPIRTVEIPMNPIREMEFREQREEEEKKKVAVAALTVNASVAAKDVDGPAVVEQSARVNAAALTAPTKRKRLTVARPFVMMRGHTAFLTFATAGNKLQPNPVSAAAAAEAAPASAVEDSEEPVRH